MTSNWKDRWTEADSDKYKRKYWWNIETRETNWSDPNGFQSEEEYIKADAQTAAQAAALTAAHTAEVAVAHAVQAAHAATQAVAHREVTEAVARREETQAAQAAHAATQAVAHREVTEAVARREETQAAQAAHREATQAAQARALRQQLFIKRMTSIRTLQQRETLEAAQQAAQATAQQQQFAQQTVLIRTLQQTAQEANKKRKLDNEDLKASRKQCKSVVDKLTEENKRLTEEIKRLTEKVSDLTKSSERERETEVMNWMNELKENNNNLVHVSRKDGRPSKNSVLL